MVYKELLLDAGGIFAGVENLERRTNDSVLIIGLGGLGIQCLKELKRETEEKLTPDNGAGGRFCFLAVDSDMHELKELEESPYTGHDFKIVSLYEPEDLLIKLEPVIKASPEYNWWFRKEGVSDPVFARTRQDGRFRFFRKAGEFRNAVMQAVRDCIAGRVPGYRLQVHVFAGMGGTTGSGCFLDACYMVGQVLKELGLYDSTMINGYFFPAEVYFCKEEFAGNLMVRKWLETNSRAALADLDRCMNFEYSDDCWLQEYWSGYHVGPVKDAPVKDAFLISAENYKRSPYRRILTDTAKYVLKYMADCSYVMWDMQLQTNRMREMAETDGRQAPYRVFRNIDLEISVKEMMIIAAHRIFEDRQLKSAVTAQPHEVRKMAEQLRLTSEEFFRDMMSGISFLISPELDYRDFRDMPEETPENSDLILDFRILQYYESKMYQVLDRLDRNERELEQDTGGSRVRNACIILENLVTDPAYGPEYAADMLWNPSGMCLIGAIDGLCKEIAERLSSERGITELRIRDVKECRQGFLHAGVFGNRARRFAEFLESVTVYYNHRIRLNVLERMEYLLRHVCRQFERLHKEYFYEYVQVFHNLKETFKYSYLYLMCDQYKEEIFGTRIVYPTELEHFLESRYSNDCDRIVSEWHRTLLNQPDIWRGCDEKKLASEVVQILKNLLFLPDSVTLGDLLEWNMPGSSVAANIYGYLGNQIIPRMNADMHRPFIGFRTAAGTEPIQQVLGLGPRLQPNILWQYRQNDPACASADVYEREKLSLIRLYTGLSLEDYRNVFRMSGPENTEDAYHLGLHIYEGTRKDPRDWRPVPGRE